MGKVKENSLLQTEIDLQKEWLDYDNQMDKEELMLENKIMKVFILSLGYTYEDIAIKASKEIANVDK